MVVTIIIALAASISSTIVGVLVALKLQRTHLDNFQAQHQAWEHAQEEHQHNWELKQQQSIAALETRLTGQVQDIQNAWQQWQDSDQQRLQALAEQQRALEKQRRLEQVLALLPHVEDVPVSQDAPGEPVILQGANLAGRDLSHRCLRQADLRQAQLAKASLFMADLSGAILTGANLADADLTGANLSRADLRDAVLTGANLQVADLQGAILIGANLLEARNLTPQQVSTAIYDSTTRLDEPVDITSARLPAAQVPAAPSAIASSTTIEIESALPTLPALPGMEVETLAEDIEAESALPTPSTLSDIEVETLAHDIEAEPVLPAPSTEALAPASEPESEIISGEHSTSAADLESEVPSPPEAAFATLLPDLESLIQQQEASSFLSPLAPQDSLLDPQVTDLLLASQEPAHTDPPDTASSRPKRRRKRTKTR